MLSSIQIILNNLTGSLGVWAVIFCICATIIHHKEERMLEGKDLIGCAAVASFFAVILFLFLTITGVK